MMMLLSLFFLTMIWNKISKMVFLYYGIMCVGCFKVLYEYNISSFIMSNYFYMDFLSWSMIYLSLLTCSISWSSFVYINEKKTLHLSFINILLLFLFMVFSVKNPLNFYFWFESSLIPIFVLIMGWGYQPERLFASKSMFYYTIFASLPLLLLSVWLFSQKDLVSFFFMSKMSFKSLNDLIYMMMLIMMLLSFLVKFPMYMFHMWLPKAHVEAPVSGSMILAGILLKLGGFGIFRLMVLSSMNYYSYYVMYFSMMGGGLISMICVLQNDMKVLIAYSSVSHMSMAIMSVISKVKMLVLSSMSMLLCHGLSSVAMFFGASCFYLRSSSRNLMLNKGFLVWAPMFSLMWCLICVSNMAGPPSFNLFTELMMFIFILGFSKLFFGPMLIMGIFSACYSLFLCALMIHGKVSKNIMMFKEFNLFEFMSLFILMFYSYFSMIFVFSMFLIL